MVTYVAFNLSDGLVRDFEVNVFSYSAVTDHLLGFVPLWYKRKKRFLPSLALTRALFATKLSISMEECVFGL